MKVLNVDLDPNDLSFDLDHSTRGKFMWAWSLLAPSALLCSSTSPTLLYSLLIVLPVSLSLGITEIFFRGALDDSDSGRYGGKVHWSLDVSYIVWIIYILFVVLRCIFAVIHIRLENDKLRDVDRPQPVFAIVARAAYSIAIPASIVLLIVYIVLAASGHRLHPHTSAFFAVNGIFALLDLLLFEIHILLEHTFWTLALAYLWVFPLSIIHYLLVAGKDTNRPYVYGVADWADPLYSLTSIFAISLLTVAVHGCIAAFCDWKHSRPGCNVFIYNCEGTDGGTDASANASANASVESGLGLGLGGKNPAPRG